MNMEDRNQKDRFPGSRQNTQISVMTDPTPGLNEGAIDAAGHFEQSGP